MKQKFLHRDSESSPSITLFTCLTGHGANVEAVVFRRCESDSYGFPGGRAEVTAAAHGGEQGGLRASHFNQSVLVSFLFSTLCT